ncbi:MAG: UbiA family prenyltransferase [Gemmatales bacterium]|nr:UbiA family prenyltransferase [Gemmatales bacterium]
MTARGEKRQMAKRDSFGNKLLSIAELCRIANLPSAWADILCGWLVGESVAYESGGEHPHGLVLSLLLLATSGLYLSGMVWNDVFDAETDLRERPYRPIPSGRVSRSSAALLALALMGIGWISGAAVSRHLHNSATVIIASLLVACILLYDAGGKHFVWGVLWLGACRFGNVLLGASPWLTAAVVPASLVALINGTYVVGLSVCARPEARPHEGVRRTLWLGALIVALALLGGLAVALAAQQGAFGRLAWTRDCGLTVWLAVAALACAWAMNLAAVLVRALRQPQPETLQAAVRRLLQGIIFLDAFLALIFAGPVALMILLLGPVSLFLGRRFAPT